MTLKSKLVAVVLGACGVFAALGLWHGYGDHKDLHDIKTVIIQAQQAAAAAKAKPPQ